MEEHTWCVLLKEDFFRALCSTIESKHEFLRSDTRPTLVMLICCGDGEFKIVFGKEFKEI